MTDPLIPNDITMTQAPNPQFAVDLIPGWSSALPEFLNVTAGTARLFNDDRVTWALECLGGVADKTVLELGPLEGGHTYMLEQAGAKSVMAIEANKRCYLKCLITKELLGMTRSRFLLGDFIPWLMASDQRFDVIWCAGVLYHMVEPTHLLELIAARTGKVHIWTHYVIEKGYEKKAPWAQPILRVENRKFRGVDIPHYVRSYFNQPQTAQYCGGVYTTSVWLRRSDILAVLKSLGFARIDIAFEDPNHPNGPAFALAASRA
jgi:hypothetical protein